MTIKSRGLGRNLSVLLGQGNTIKNEESPASRQNLPINQLQPGKYQPRKEMDETALEELAESIKKQGILQPIVVRPVNDLQYEIIAGERRWRACKSLAMAEVPVIIKNVDDETAMAMALIENLQREDLNPMDQARAMHRLVEEFSLTHQQVAEILAKSRAAVSNYLRLLNLAPEVRNLLENGDIDMGHARALLSLETTKQAQVAQLIVFKNLSVRETEGLVNRVLSGLAVDTSKSEKNALAHDFKERIQRLEKQLKTQVKLKPGKNGNGKIIIHYQDMPFLEKMIALLMQ
ncbi:chromosome partitioning protein parB (plasmid) [Legionella adelaidensis]|uniref:Probable chromosome-partitioning protein ParB n=1 Tax=Legionella adelaidensis TaxID=45056 RepID=A0A0W0R179_9GAMM|nr:ParB/RepB/Spo0J family partition protein [Legionella adelaidensis]KTC64851.1 chromosome partitioning protein parB [Legionella adelaidensis]VEH82978.1 chromosome partitioning protein parB [Legionella adelaidensis]